MMQKKLSESFEKLSNAKKSGSPQRRAEISPLSTPRAQRRAEIFLGFPRERTERRDFADYSKRFHH